MTRLSSNDQFSQSAERQLRDVAFHIDNVLIEYGGSHAKSWTALIAALLLPPESDSIELDLGALSR